MNTEDIKTIHRFRIALIKDADMLPQFIDNKKVTDKEVYEIGRAIIKELINLVQYKVLTKRVLDRWSHTINSLFEDMIHISPNLSILYYEHVMFLMDYYIDLFEKEEMYEAVHNFKKLKSNLYGNLDE